MNFDDLPFRPFQHQINGLEISRKRPRYCWFWEPGTGKTLAMLMICKDQPMKTLVLCPKSIMNSAWLSDVGKMPGMTAVVAWHSNPRKREIMIRAHADIIITNYETFRNNIDIFQDADFDRLIIDESSKIKNPFSQITEACIRFADKMKSVYLMSGTPAANGPEEYYAHLRACDINAVSCQNVWQWRYHFFHPQENYIRVKGGRQKKVIAGWAMKEEHRGSFHATLGRYSQSIRKGDVLDLPPSTDNIIEVELSAAEMSAYKAMQKSMVASHESGVSVTSSTVGRAKKLRQLASGASYLEANGYPSCFEPNNAPVRMVNKGDRRYIVFGESKLKEVKSLLEEIGDNQVIIWAQHRFEIDQLSSLLQSNGQTASLFGILDGRTKDGATLIDLFQRGGIKYLICQPASVAHGVTLVAAPYAIHYSLGYSYELYDQAKARIDRIGQTRNTTHYHMLSKGTCDRAVLVALRKKQKQSDIILDLLAQGGADVESGKANRSGDER